MLTGAVATQDRMVWGSGTPEVVDMLRHEYGMRVRSVTDVITSKLYHCDDERCRKPGIATDDAMQALYCTTASVDSLP